MSEMIAGGALVLGLASLSRSQNEITQEQIDAAYAKTPVQALLPQTTLLDQVSLDQATTGLADPSQAQRTVDLFITDTSYTVDETALGMVQTGTAASPQPSTTITSRDGETLSKFADLKADSTVRFVSIASNTVTDYMQVRSLTVGPTAITFTVDAPVLLQYSNQYVCQLVRRWYPVPLPLTTGFKLVTVCEVKGFAFCGLSSGNLYEGTTGVPQQDYIGLQIAELPGRVASTNPFMQNCLAVLPTHMQAYHPSSWNDARDAQYVLPDGFAKTVYDNPVVAVNTITPRLVDRRGNTVTAARFHIWLRVTAKAL